MMQIRIDHGQGSGLDQIPASHASPKWRLGVQGTPVARVSRGTPLSTIRLGIAHPLLRAKVK